MNSINENTWWKYSSFPPIYVSVITSVCDSEYHVSRVTHSYQYSAFCYIFVIFATIVRIINKYPRGPRKFIWSSASVRGGSVPSDFKTDTLFKMNLQDFCDTLNLSCYNYVITAWHYVIIILLFINISDYLLICYI